MGNSPTIRTVPGATSAHGSLLSERARSRQGNDDVWYADALPTVV